MVREKPGTSSNSSNIRRLNRAIRIQPPTRMVTIDVRELWEYRELLSILIWRDIKVRYKQTALGIVWVVLQPLLTMVIFSFIFGKLAGLPSGGIPYPVFTFTALLPWQLFSTALTLSGNSLVANQPLITKVYVPRLMIPLAGLLSGLVDFAISLVILIGLMLFYKVQISWQLLTLPIFILLALLSAFAAGLWLSALNVEYRDVRYTIPFIAQAWMFLTPIAYSITIVPEKLLWLYSLNPMVSVVEGFRWAILGNSGLSWQFFLLSLLVVVIFLGGGLFYFKRMEDNFADVI